MNRLTTTLAAACFALSTATAFAQTTTPPASGERTRPNPEQREKMHANVKAAREACKGDKMAKLK